MNNVRFKKATKHIAKHFKCKESTFLKKSKHNLIFFSVPIDSKLLHRTRKRGFFLSVTASVNFFMIPNCFNDKIPRPLTIPATPKKNFVNIHYDFTFIIC